MSPIKLLFRGFAVSVLLFEMAAGFDGASETFRPEQVLEIQQQIQQVLPTIEKSVVSIELGTSAGSGVIVSEEGIVLTAAHVTMEVGKNVEVILQDGTRLRAVTLGIDSETDAAMVKISQEIPKDKPLHVALMDVEKTAKLGDWVIALGHSGGFDVERGAVARIGRIARVAQSTWQSDCALIGGDSGGPLFDLKGRLLGIHSRVGKQLSVNLHVPLRCFVRSWDSLLDSAFLGDGIFAKKPSKGTGFLGVATQKADQGFLVTKVGRESPAEKSGIEVDDILVSINGVLLNKQVSLRSILSEFASSDKVEIELVRNGEKQNFTLRLAAR